jgi:hypothetical protein
MVFVALRVGGRRHVSGPSGSAVAHANVNDRIIMPPAGRSRNKLSMPFICQSDRKLKGDSWYPEWPKVADAMSKVHVYGCYRAIPRGMPRPAVGIDVAM